MPQEPNRRAMAYGRIQRAIRDGLVPRHWLASMVDEEGAVKFFPKDLIDLTESEVQDSTTASSESSSEESDTDNCRYRSTGPKTWKIKNGMHCDDEEERNEEQQDTEHSEEEREEERDHEEQAERSSFTTMVIVSVGLLFIVNLSKLLTMSKWDLLILCCDFVWKYPLTGLITFFTLVALPRLVFGHMFNVYGVYALEARSVTTGENIKIIFSTPVVPWTGAGKSHWIGLYPQHETRYYPATFRAAFWGTVQTGTSAVLKIPTGTASIPSGAYKVVLFEGRYAVKRIINVNVCDQAQSGGCAMM